MLRVAFDPIVSSAAVTEKTTIMDSSCAPDWSGSILMSVLE
jgi:hypothetical protein